MHKYLLVLCAVFMLSGCEHSLKKEPLYPNHSIGESDPFIAQNYKAADSLINQLAQRISKSQPVIIATVVNIDSLHKSSTFGRIVSEQVSGRFTQSGYSMIEMKFRGDVYMEQTQGELILTREIKNLATSQNAQAVIVGTYAQSKNNVFVNLKVVNPNNNVVMAVCDYSFGLNPNISTMLEQSSNSSTRKNY